MKLYSYITLQKDKFANVTANAFWCIDSPSLNIISAVCILPEKEVNKMLLFIANLVYEVLKIMKGHALVYLTLLNVTIFQILKRTIKKAKMQKFLLQLQKPTLKYYQLFPQITKWSFYVIIHLSGKCYFKMQKYQLTHKRN